MRPQLRGICEQNGVNMHGLSAFARPGIVLGIAVFLTPPAFAVPPRGEPGVRTAAAERQLAAEVRLETVEAWAVLHNPELAEARARTRAARESASAASRLPEPEFEYQLWSAPLARPYALDRAEMHMFGLRQAFPAPGSLAARGEAASEQAGMLAKGYAAREQDIRARVRRAYAEYHRAHREYELHLEHAKLAEQVLEVSRAAYQGGRGTQQDVLRAGLELSRLHNDVATVEQERASARGLLNTLMARPVDAALGLPAARDVAKLNVRFEDLARELTNQRPEVGAAESAIRMRERELDAARSSARWPSFMAGVQYMYAPPMEEPHNYGLMFSMTLPWLSARYSDEVRAAEATLAAEKSALVGVQNGARLELFDGVQRLRAAQQSYAVIEQALLPQAQQSFETARATYRGGQGETLALLEAVRVLLDVRIERERALARIEMAVADVERAAGPPKRKTP